MPIELSYKRLLQDHVAILLLKTALRIFYTSYGTILQGDCTGLYPFIFKHVARAKHKDVYRSLDLSRDFTLFAWKQQDP